MKRRTPGCRLELLSRIAIAWLGLVRNVGKAFPTFFVVSPGCFVTGGLTSSKVPILGLNWLVCSLSLIGLEDRATLCREARSAEASAAWPWPTCAVSNTAHLCMRCTNRTLWDGASSIQSVLTSGRYCFTLSLHHIDRVTRRRWA